MFASEGNSSEEIYSSHSLPRLSYLRHNAEKPSITVLVCVCVAPPRHPLRSLPLFMADGVRAMSSLDQRVERLIDDPQLQSNAYFRASREQLTRLFLSPRRRIPIARYKQTRGVNKPMATPGKDSSKGISFPTMCGTPPRSSTKKTKTKRRPDTRRPKFVTGFPVANLFLWSSCPGTNGLWSPRYSLASSKKKNKDAGTSNVAADPKDVDMPAFEDEDVEMKDAT